MQARCCPWWRRWQSWENNHGAVNVFQPSKSGESHQAVASLFVAPKHLQTTLQIISRADSFPWRPPMDALGFGVKRSLYKGRGLFSKNQIAWRTLQGVFGIHASLSVCTKSEILGTFFFGRRSWSWKSLHLMETGFWSTCRSLFGGV